jgi:hypothetical protein
MGYDDTHYSLLESRRDDTISSVSSTHKGVGGSHQSPTLRPIGLSVRLIEYSPSGTFVSRMAVQKLNSGGCLVPCKAVEHLCGRVGVFLQRQTKTKGNHEKQSN